MPSKRNIDLLDALKDTLKGAGGSFFLVDYQGLEAAGERKLRKTLSEKGARMFVAKNTLITKAMSDLGMPNLGELKGPSALVMFEDPAGAAKALKEFAKDNEKNVPQAKGGLLSGQALSAKQVATLADLPSKKELQAELVGVLQATMSEFVSVLGGKQTELVGILDAYVQKQSAAA